MDMINQQQYRYFLIAWTRGTFSSYLPEAVDLVMTPASPLWFIWLILWLHYYTHKAADTSTACISINHAEIMTAGCSSLNDNFYYSGRAKALWG